MPTPTRTGYNFGGWKKGSLIVTASTQNTTVGNHTLTSQWTPQTFTISFNKQSGSGGSSTATATYGQALPTITIPTRNGYKFEGYFSSTGGSGTKYYNADGTSATTWSQTSSITLYAYWSIPPTTLTISGNGVSTNSYGNGVAMWDIHGATGVWFNNYGIIILTAGGGGGRWIYSINSIYGQKEDDEDEDDLTNNTKVRPTVTSTQQTGAISVTIPAYGVLSYINFDRNDSNYVSYYFQAKSKVDGSVATAFFSVYAQYNT